MSLQIGIIGLPNVGKSTLFNALTRAHAAVAAYPFTTIEPNVGVAILEDPRLDQVAALVQPERVTPAAVQFVDIAGLVRGAHRGEGLGNQFLSHIRNVDAVIMVVRCFADENVPHVTAVLDPVADIETVELELIMADLSIVERRLERIRSAAKAQPREYAAQIAFLERVYQQLNAGHQVGHLAENPAEVQWLAELNLLSAKPTLLVANVSENDLPDGGPLADRVRIAAQERGATAAVISAKLEMELADWPDEEAAAYRAELGLSESGLQQLARASYRLLNLITFFTATGEREVRAWPLIQGSTVWQAAGKIHTDMQRGFIRAEVIPWDRLVAAGSMAAARERGILRLEGRDYVVQDGDVIHVRFAV